MKKTTNGNMGLVIAIIFASLVIGGSIMFFALQGQGTQQDPNLTTAIETGIQEFIKKQQAAAPTPGQNDLAKNLVKPNDSDYIRGNAEAEISIIEYSDYECPFCKRFHPTMKQVMAEYEGKVNWIYRDFPLGFHDPLATAEAVASRCVGRLAGADKFWEYADLIFEKTNSNGRGLELDELPTMATSIGIDATAFAECTKDPAIAAQVKKSINEGSSAGVSGTPGSFILNNKTGETEFIPGALPFARITPLIEGLLN